MNIPACINHEVEEIEPDFAPGHLLGRCIQCGLLFLDPQNLDAEIEESIAIFEAACRGEQLL